MNNNDGCNTTTAAAAPTEVNENNNTNGGGVGENPYTKQGIMDLKTLLAESPYPKVCKKAADFFYQER